MIKTHQNVRLYPLNDDPTTPVITTLSGKEGLLFATIKVRTFDLEALSLLIGAQYETHDGKPFYQPIKLDDFSALNVAAETTIAHTYAALPPDTARFVGYRHLKTEGTFGNGLGDFQLVHREVIQSNRPFPHMMIDANKAELFAPSALIGVIPAPVRKFLGRHFGLNQPSLGKPQKKWFFPQKRF